MKDYIYLGAKVFLGKAAFIVISEIDNNGYFYLEHEEYIITKRLNITEITLNGYSFTGTPILKYRKMDYDLGI